MNLSVNCSFFLVNISNSLLLLIEYSNIVIEQKYVNFCVMGCFEFDPVKQFKFC